MEMSSKCKDLANGLQSQLCLFEVTEVPLFRAGSKGYGYTMLPVVAKPSSDISPITLVTLVMNITGTNSLVCLFGGAFFGGSDRVSVTSPLSADEVNFDRILSATQLRSVLSNEPSSGSWWKLCHKPLSKWRFNLTS